MTGWLTPGNGRPCLDGPSRLATMAGMGLQSVVLGIGPFSREIVPYLGYDEDKYADTREGITIVEYVFFSESGTTESLELASCFGIDPWDFNQHELDPAKADLEGLEILSTPNRLLASWALSELGFGSSSCRTGEAR